MFPSSVCFARLLLQQRVDNVSTPGKTRWPQPQHTPPGAGTGVLLPTSPEEEVVTTTVIPQVRRDEGTQGPSDLGVVTPSPAQGMFAGGGGAALVILLIFGTILETVIGLAPFTSTA